MTHYIGRHKSSPQHEQRLSRGSNICNESFICSVCPPDIVCWSNQTCSAIFQNLQDCGFTQPPYGGIVDILGSLITNCPQFKDNSSSTSTTEPIMQDSSTPASSHATSFTSPDTSSSSLESTFVNVPTLANPTTHLSSSGIATLISIGTQTQSSAPAFSTPNGLDGGNPATAKPLSTLQSLAAESTLLLSSGGVSSSVTQRLHTAQASPSPSASLPPGGLSTALPTPSGPHHPNIGEIIAIILGALALLFCIAFVVLFFLRRRARARRKARRTYSGSPWQRIKPHIYDESSSRPESSIWTWFGSIPIDTEYTAQPEPRPYSPESHLSEKGAGASAASERLDASSPRPSPCPSPTPTETRPLARDASSTHSLHEDPPYLTVPISSAPEASSSSKLLALSGTEYAVANPFSDVHEVRVGRSVSGVSHTTASSGDVQSVEAL